MRSQKTKFEQSGKRVAFIFVFLVAITSSSWPAHAHGELLIRIADVTQKIKTTTNNPAALYLERGELHRMDLDWLAAESDYQRAEQLDPKLVGVELCRGKWFFDSGNFEAARAHFTRLLAHDPENGEALIGRARTSLKLHDVARAIQDFQMGLDVMRAPTAEIYLEFGEILASENRDNDAVRILDLGIFRCGPVLSLHTAAMELEKRNQKVEPALVRLDGIIERAERKESWLAQRGEILATLGRTVEAAAAFEAAERAISLLPWRLQQGSAMLQLRERVANAVRRLPEKSDFSVSKRAAGVQEKSVANRSSD